MVRAARACLAGAAGLPVALVSVAVAIAATPAPAPAKTTPAKVAVAPSRAGAHGAFAVRFIAPVVTGVSGGPDYGYLVSASTTAGASAQCEQSISMAPTVPVAGQVVKVVLRPRSEGWCAGAYTGLVLETIRIPCGPPVDSGPQDRLLASLESSFMCPMMATDIRSVPLGGFRFTVAG